MLIFKNKVTYLRTKILCKKICPCDTALNIPNENILKYAKNQTFHDLWLRLLFVSLNMLKSFLFINEESKSNNEFHFFRFFAEDP